MIFHMKLTTLTTAIMVSTFVPTLASAQEISETNAPATAAAQAESTSTPPAPVTGSSTGKVVPNIAVRWDCGSCEENAKVAPLIEKTYQAEALAKGHTVSTTETVQVAIKEYRQRHPAARSLFGAFSGKDKLATKLSFRGKDYNAEDYSANAFQGMNSLCESVARQTLAQLLTAL